MRSRLGVILLGWLGWLAATATAAAPSIEVSLFPREVTIGDRIEMVVSILADSKSDTAVRFQAWDETLGPVEILEVGPVEQLREDDRLIFRQRLALTVFQIGEVVLPPVEAVITDDAGDTPLTSVSSRLLVHSVLPEEAEAVEARPPAPPERPGMGDAFWWSSAALLTTCILGVVALWRLSEETTTDETRKPRLAPMEELRRSLAALRDESAVEPIHAEISLAVRRFLGRIVGFPAAESTTTEVARQLRRRNLPADLLRKSSELLLACDMVMFARREVALETARERIEDAQTIADAFLAATRQDETGDSNATGGGR